MGAQDISQLLTYSQGIVGDWVKQNNLSGWLAPVVPVVTNKFQYRNYGSGNAFLSIDTRRAMGGSSARLSYTASDAWGVLGEHSLETTIDDMERRDNPDTEPELERIKVRDLSLTILNNDFKDLLAFMKSGVAVTTGFGNWSNDTVDPIKEIDAIRKTVFDTFGVVLNRLFMDLTAWMPLKNNAKVLGRLPTTTIKNATLAAVSEMLAIPADIRIGGGALYTDSGDTLKNNVLMFYGQDNPTAQDPSFMKTFRRAGTGDMFTGMQEYREPPIRSDVYWLDWAQLRVITGAGIVSRLAIT